jgi:AmmeMemoRadiSam system protein B
MDPVERPRLRYLDVFPLPEQEGRRLFGLRDPERLSNQVLCLTLEAACVLQFLDGAHNLSEVQTEYRSKYGVEFPMELLRQLCQILDENHFLASQRFEEHVDQLLTAFRSSETRPAFHAGASYDENPAILKQTLGDFFLGPQGPGLPVQFGSNGHLPGIIVPHIDLRIGGVSYAWAYKELAEAEPPELFIVLGTGHNGLRNLYSLTRKAFATPLGEVPVDWDFVDRLTMRSSEDLFVDELAHRSEHTIEFQVLFIQQLFGNATPIVPILCSFSYATLLREAGRARVEAFIANLIETMAEDGRRITFVTSADLAHVGPRYGDEKGFTGTNLERIKEADREMLAHVERVDAKGFLGYVEGEQDRRRICGFSPIYTMLCAMNARGGRVVAHDHGEMDELGSICSFASVVFE